MTEIKVRDLKWAFLSRVIYARTDNTRTSNFVQHLNLAIFGPLEILDEFLFNDFKIGLC